jgi:small subunit ribosomal protein S20
MANVASAQKRIRQTTKRTARNKHVRTGVRSVMKTVREAVAGKDKKAAQTALASAIKKIDQAVAKGVYPKRTGSRYVSRLSAHVAALA